MIGGGEIRCYPRAYNGQEHNVDSGIVFNNFPKNCANYDAYQAWIAGGGSARLDNDRVVNSFKGVGGIMPSLGGLLRSVLGGTTSTGTSVETTYQPSGTSVNGNPIMTPTGMVETQRTTKNSSNFETASCISYSFSPCITLIDLTPRIRQYSVRIGAV